MGSADIYKLLSVISALTIGIPLVVIILVRNYSNHIVRALLVYFILCSLSELAGFIVNEDWQLNLIFNIFTLLEFLIVTSIYYFEYENHRVRLIITSITLVFYGFAFLHFSSFAPITGTDDRVNTTEAFILLLFSGFFFSKLLIDEKISDLKNYYFFWINLAFALYFGMTIILFFNSKFIENSRPPIGYVLWGLHLLMNIATNVLMSIGIWKVKLTRHY